MKYNSWLIAAFLIFCFPFEGRGQAGETKSAPSSWTIDSLKAHYDALRASDKELSETRHRHAQELREAADKRYEQRFQAQETSLASYKTTANEFRGTIADTNSRFISRSELGGYVYGFVVVMGVLVAWLAFSSKRRAQPEWAMELLKEMRDSRKVQG